MKEPRRLALSTERLAELSTDDLHEVNGGATVAGGCPLLHPPNLSEPFATVCGCLTVYCPTVNRA